MHISLVINNLIEMSGASKILTFIGNHFQRLQHEVDIVCINRYEESVNNEIDNIICFNLSTKNRGLWRLNAIKCLHHYSITARPDVIISFSSDTSVITRFALRGTDIPVISCERSDPSSLPFLWKKLTAWAYAKSDFCVFQTQFALDSFHSSVIESHSQIIPNPFVPRSNPPENGAVRKKTIVSAGRFIKQKRFDVLITAFARVVSKHPEYKLIIYGDGSLRADYTEQINELGISDYVELPGFCPNISEEFKYDGIFVLSSDYEGIPNSLLEALSVGIPCVATDCTPGGARFLTDNGKRGLLVGRDNPEELSEAIEKYINNEETARDYGNKGLAVRTIFEPEKILSEWVNILERVYKASH